jgi:nicotinamidase-related amidase
MKPATEQLPRSSKVLLLIDFINPLNFPGADGLAPRALLAAQATARLRRKLDKEGVPTIFANDNFGNWNSDFKEQVAAIEKTGGPSAQIARALKPRRHDLTILKPQYSAFYASTRANTTEDEERALDYMKAVLRCDVSPAGTSA